MVHSKNDKNVYEEEKRPRNSDKDIFLAKFLSNADFKTGFYQVPRMPDFEIEKPDGMVVWSKRNSCKDKSKHCLCFYEYDCFFDGKRGIYNTLKYGSKEAILKLIDEMRQFAFVICPDYSVYGNFPNYKQIEALSKSREVGYILSTYGIKVVVNYRATFEWSYELALTGFSENPVVAIGTLGAIKERINRTMLKESVDVLVRFVRPRIIIVYGSAPSEVFSAAIDAGIEIWQYNASIKAAFEGK